MVKWKLKSKSKPKIYIIPKIEIEIQNGKLKIVSGFDFELGLLMKNGFNYMFTDFSIRR